MKKNIIIAFAILFVSISTYLLSNAAEESLSLSESEAQVFIQNALEYYAHDSLTRHVKEYLEATQTPFKSLMNAIIADLKINNEDIQVLRTIAQMHKELLEIIPVFKDQVALLQQEIDKQCNERIEHARSQGKMITYELSQQVEQEVQKELEQDPQFEIYRLAKQKFQELNVRYLYVARYVFNNTYKAMPQESKKQMETNYQQIMILLLSASISSLDSLLETNGSEQNNLQVDQREDII